MALPLLPGFSVGRNVSGTDRDVRPSLPSSLVARGPERGKDELKAVGRAGSRGRGEGVAEPSASLPAGIIC